MAHVSERPARPRLLVSVRNAGEAGAALAGGCDILDVKEPARGSLGMAEVARIEEVARLSAGLPCSAALGEAIDWRDVADLPALPGELNFVKLGLAGLGTASDWCDRWGSVRRRFEERAGKSLNWIGVVYADWQSAAAPRPQEVIEAAAATECAGLLFDTFSKDGKTLLDWYSIEQMQGYCEQIGGLGMMSAIAGRVQISALPALVEIAADIIAIRTAACRNGDRSGEISADAVRRFKTALSPQFISIQSGPKHRPPF